MADISQELSQIKNSVYGKNMRTAIHDAIKKVNEDGGGGGGSATITELWLSNDGTTVGTTYDLSDDINNYDVLWFKIGNQNDISRINRYIQASIMVSLIGTSSIGINDFFRRTILLSFNGSAFTVVSSSSDGEGSDYAPRIYQIVGVKF